MDDGSFQVIVGKTNRALQNLLSDSELPKLYHEPAEL